jgi:hypothetical protein
VSCALSGVAAATQQVEITTVHKIRPAAREANRAVAQIVSLPGDAGWNARATGQALRNDPT